MKSPAEQVPDPVARELTEDFITKHARRKVKAAGKSSKGKASRSTA